MWTEYHPLDEEYSDFCSTKVDDFDFEHSIWVREHGESYVVIYHREGVTGASPDEYWGLITSDMETLSHDSLEAIKRDGDHIFRALVNIQRIRDSVYRKPSFGDVS